MRPARPAELRRSSRGRARTAPRPVPGHPCREQREPFLLGAAAPRPRPYANATSCPRADSAWASGTSGRKCPSQGMQLNRTRMSRSSLHGKKRAASIVSDRDGDVPRATGPSAGRDRRGRRGRGARAPGRGAVRRRARARGMGGRRRARRAPRSPRLARVADRRARPRPLDRDHPLLLRRHSHCLRREGARASSATRTSPRSAAASRTGSGTASRSRHRTRSPRTSDAATRATC